MFLENGYEIISSVFTASECNNIESLLSSTNLQKAGTRNILDVEWSHSIVEKLRSHQRLSEIIPKDHIAVQCTFFEKSKSSNWLVSLHQDLSIPVKNRVSNNEFTGWSEKEGNLYVQPPLSILEQLIAIRLHIDVCGNDDGPLKVVPKSHRLGIISAEDGLLIRDQSVEIFCTAKIGDVVVMHPLVLHASSKATGNSRRRVLHVLFAPSQLPHGLQWKNSA